MFRTDAFFFIKFGQEEFMKEFLNEGTMFLQRLSFYRNIEHSAKGDKNEGLSAIHHRGKLIVETTDKQHTLILNNKNYVRIQNEANDFVYCMYAITNEHENALIDERCKDLGDTCVLIKNTPLFLERVKSECKRLGWGLRQGIVEYLDFKKHNGEIGPFKKSVQFKYQNELRFVFDDDIQDDSYKFKIGDISDIASIFPNNDFSIQISSAT